MLIDEPPVAQIMTDHRWRYIYIYISGKRERAGMRERERDKTERKREGVAGGRNEEEWEDWGRERREKEREREGRDEREVGRERESGLRGRERASPEGRTKREEEIGGERDRGSRLRYAQVEGPYWGPFDFIFLFYRIQTFTPKLSSFSVWSPNLNFSLHFNLQKFTLLTPNFLKNSKLIHMKMTVLPF